MPNGTPGDDPLIDILGHGLTVYSPRASELIRSIAAVASDTQLRELGSILSSTFNPYVKPDVSKLESYLSALHEKLVREATERGFEIDSE